MSLRTRTPESDLEEIQREALIVLDTFALEYSVKPGGTLIIELETGGSLKIEGWDQNTVAIELDLGNLDPDDIRMEMGKVSNGVEVIVERRHKFSHSSRGVHLKAKVPKVYDLDVETMGGVVEVSGIEGLIEGRTMGGSLDLKKLKGEIDFHTMGGNIDLSHSQLEGRVKTMGGNIQLTDVNGTVKASTMGGNITYGNGTTGSVDEAVVISTMGGNISVESAPAGADVKTMGGNIQIRSARKFIRAKTMGGDITIDAVDGQVRASTMGGDVEVTVVGDDDAVERNVSLASKGGDIILTVPEGLSMDFDITLTYTRRREGRYHITSDFDLNLAESEEWEGGLFSRPHKEIRGTGKVSGGKNRITVETVNGDIIIKKG
ncbi:hypothetical protein ES708_32722 [subsurface metagenome]